MAKKNDYFMRQCTLERGNTTTVSWIPEKFAKVGKIVKLKDKEDNWVDGWKVMEASSQSRSYDECNMRSQDFKHQRKVSDI